MIPKASITAWREKAPWVTDEQVEQDLVLSRVLVELFSDPLVQYVESSGQLNNVVTVLIELAEFIKVDHLLVIAKQFPCAAVQRLGYLLEEFTKLDMEKLNQWLKFQSVRATALIPGKNYRKNQQNKRWKVWVNEKVEPDL